MENIIIKTSDLNLYYPTFINKSLRSSLLKKNNYDYQFIHALKNINLIFNSKDRIGLIGHNGSGKSTLLKILADIHQPTSGSIFKKYKTLTLLDFQSGINKSGSGIENIYLFGYLLGLNNNEIKNKIQKIIEYSELENFIHLPLSTYSSGMIARLTTSIALFADSKIVLMDEYFGTLDDKFRKKVFNSFNNKISTIELFVIASHDINLIKTICNRVITLENGEVVNDKKL